MPGATYLAGYQQKRLNEVVIPGAHDAGIYLQNLAANVRTQSVDIYDQARAGCRFFDCRIAIHETKVGTIGSRQKVKTFEAYHLDGSLVREHKGHQNVGHAGGWGGKLDDMLTHARLFVGTHATEFLILKFSKCYGWTDIAQKCQTILGNATLGGGDVWCKVTGNLNEQTVASLAGKVITVFDESARGSIANFPANAAWHGVRYIKNLVDPGSVYDPNYDGIQYYGKFSSTDNVDTNTKKQTALLVGAAATNMDVMGMMYWTTTGLVGNISTRNQGMWTGAKQGALRQTWEAGLKEAIDHRLGNEISNLNRIRTAKAAAATPPGVPTAPIAPMALGGRAKAFMPNVVMMDFVDINKCNTIDGLNQMATTALAKLIF